MKCQSCGTDQKRSIINVLKVVKHYEGIYGGLTQEAKDTISEELSMSKQMVNRYIKVYNKYQDEIEKEQFEMITGKGINELYKEQKPRKMPFSTEFEVLKKDFPSLKYQDFIAFLNQYQTEGEQ